jgi:hypothetical protein
MHTYIHAYIHTYIHTYTHAHMHTYMHTYIHTCIHTYIHTYMHVSRKGQLAKASTAGPLGGHDTGNGRASPRPPAGHSPPPMPSGLEGLLGLRPCDPQGLSWKIMEATHTPRTAGKNIPCVYTLNRAGTGAADCSPWPGLRSSRRQGCLLVKLMRIGVYGEAEHSTRLCPKGARRTT